jgi:hypothetical protein
VCEQIEARPLTSSASPKRALYEARMIPVSLASRLVIP